jgi:cobalamin biosynthesis protein CobD/CbiB
MNSLSAIAVQETTPEEMLGRTFGTITALSTVGIPLGTVLIAAAAETAGIISTLVGMGAVYLLLAISMFFNPALKQMDSARRSGGR